ncbi:uncharacterized protein EURHEDRAFT_386156, partial [Aspergillus ruber CBS 135680]
MTAPSETRELPHFRSHVTKATAAREHSYKHKHAILLFYEENGKDDENEAEALSSCLQEFFGITATILKIARDDMTPAETLQHTINQTIDTTGPCGDDYERSLIIIAYIGEAVVDDGHVLFSTFTFQQAMFWDTIREALFTENERLSHIDALGLIDCCNVPETTVQTSRKCQVLAYPRSGSGVTLTRQLTDAARLLQQRGSAWTTVNSLFEEMQRHDSKPCNYASKMALHQISGDKPISLRFKQLW